MVKQKNDLRIEPDIVIRRFHPHPYASVNLQVQRVNALRALSQPTDIGPPCGTYKFTLIVTIGEFFCKYESFIGDNRI